MSLLRTRATVFPPRNCPAFSSDFIAWISRGRASPAVPASDWRSQNMRSKARAEPSPSRAGWGWDRRSPFTCRFDVGVGFRRCELIRGEHIPLLASPQGGVAARSIEKSRSYLVPRRRGGFPFVLNRKTTPGSRSADASRNLFNCSAPLLAVMQGGEYIF